MMSLPVGWYCHPCRKATLRPQFRLGYRGRDGREVPPAPPLCPYCRRALIFVIDSMIDGP